MVKYKIKKNECKKIECIIDTDTLNDSYRNNQNICSYASQLYKNLERLVQNNLSLQGMMAFSSKTG